MCRGRDILLPGAAAAEAEYDGREPGGQLDDQYSHENLLIAAPAQPDAAEDERRGEGKPPEARRKNQRQNDDDPGEYDTSPRPAPAFSVGA